jgi:cell division ATPase FtsA
VGRKERYLVGLDVGTSKISAIVGEATDDGARHHRHRPGGLARHQTRRGGEPRSGG